MCVCVCACVRVCVCGVCVCVCVCTSAAPKYTLLHLFGDITVHLYIISVT